MQITSNDASDPFITIKVYKVARWFFYSICIFFYIATIGILIKYEFSAGAWLQFYKMIASFSIGTCFFIIFFEFHTIKYNGKEFSYHYFLVYRFDHVSYRDIRRMWIFFGRSPSQPLDGLNIELKSGKVIKIGRTAFTQPAYSEFEKTLQEQSGIDIEGYSPLLAKPRASRKKIVKVGK